MIMSGWILPDYTEVRCKSYANNKEHIKVVERYLNNLKAAEPKLYSEIIKISQMMKLPSTALDDIAVNVLGWTKVNDKPFKTIYYLSGTLFENMIIRYINLGYNLVPIYRMPAVKIPRPNMYL